MFGFTIGATFPYRIFSRTCLLRGKNDVQMKFDDSYILYVTQIDVFSSSFELVFNNTATFL